MKLTVQIAPKNNKGLLLKNPVMAASGTFGYGTEYSEICDIQRLGAIVCKGTTLKPREGNPQPRLVETAAGVLNSIGLENIGIEALIKGKAPIWASWKVPVIVNIAAEAVAGYAKLASRLEGVAWVSGIELNISCPNVKAGGMEFGTNPLTTSLIVKEVKKVTSLPVIVKLTPNVTDVAEIARAAAEAGADALTLINTVRGMAIDIKSRKPILGSVVGGLSGPAIKPIALYQVYRVAEVVDIPIIGCGGIVSAADAIEFLMAGASAVQVGTANLINPDACVIILEGLERFMHQQQIENLAELIGAGRQQTARRMLDESASR